MDAERAFYAVAQADQDLALILGRKSNGQANIHWGWSPEPVDASGYPRITYFTVVETPRGNGLSVAQLQVDIAVWPTGEDGGPGRLRAIDARLQEIFEARSWVHGDGRFYSIALDGRTIPADADRALRLSRDYEIHVSPALVGA